jgi:hypothetical protein
MFIYDFSRIHRPFAALAGPFRHHAAAWIKDLLSHDETAPRVRCGSTIEREGVIVLPVRVEDGSTFSRLDADIELARVQPNVCQLTLSGSYEPVIRASLALEDGRISHRLAEGYVRELTENLSLRLTELATPQRTE